MGCRSHVLPATIFVCLVIVGGSGVYGDISGFGAGMPNINELPIAQSETMLREKCLKNSGSNDSYNIISEAKDKLEGCIAPLINIEVLKREIEVARPNGDIDVVFNKYCKKVPDFKNCVHNYTVAFDTCLDENEKVTKRIIANVTELLLSFMCYDEGDRLALFYAEGGKDCLSSHNETIIRCFKTTMNKYQPFGQLEFKFEENQCKSIADLKRCIVPELEKCKQPTPANMVDALFELIRRKTPCSKYVPYRT